MKAARLVEPTQASDTENDEEHEQLVEAATAEDADEEENLETHVPCVMFRSTPRHGSTVVAQMSDDCKRKAQILTITFSAPQSPATSVTASWKHSASDRLRCQRSGTRPWTKPASSRKKRVT